MSRIKIIFHMCKYILFFLTIWCQMAEAQQCNQGFDPAFDIKPFLLTNCTDESSVPGFDGEITYRLKLVNVKSNSSGGLTLEEKASIEQDIFATFSADHDLLFDISWVDVVDAALESSTNVTANSKYKQITEDLICDNVVLVISKGFNEPEVDGGADVGSGFGFAIFESSSSYQRTICHELGHTLGLYHTFENTQVTAGGLTLIGTDEHITRSLTGSCACNCDEAGDLVCDTPADPSRYIDFVGNPYRPFTCTATVTTQTVEDNCNQEFSNQNTNDLVGNVMSYIRSSNCSGASITEGQNILIRETLSSFPEMQARLSSAPELPEVSSNNLISEPTVIDRDLIFSRDLVVESDLTIKNCTIKFKRDFGIIMKAGTTLSVKNATLTHVESQSDLCTPTTIAPWNGIVVQSDNSSDFSEIYIYDNSTISDAKTAITTTSGESPISITISGSSIANSTKSIIGLNSNTVCNLRTSDMNSISLQSSEVKIFGCTFQGFGQGVGIDLLDCSLEMNKFSPSQTRNSVVGWDEGLRFVGTDDSQVRISHTDFDDIDKGINIGHPGVVKIHDNTFDINSASFNMGIEAFNLIDFDIHHNDFSIDGGGSQSNVFGVNIGCSAINVDNPSMVRSNNFVGVGVPLHNFCPSDDDGGLMFVCNTMDNSNKDMLAQADVAPVQGIAISTSSPDFGSASNLFHHATNPLNDIDHSVSGMMTYFYNDLIDVREEPTSNTASVFTVPNISPVSCDGSSIIDPNPTDPIGTGPVIPKRTSVVFDVLNGIIVDTRDSLRQLMDNGNTPTMITAIGNNAPTNPGTLLTMIGNIAPNVSSEAVTELFDNSIYFTEQEIVTVIEESPMVLDDDYISHMVYESGSFSAGSVLAIRHAYQTHQSLRKSLTYKLRSALIQRQNEVRYILNYHHHTDWDPAFNQTLYSSSPSWTKHVKMINSYITDSRSAQAQSYMNTITYSDLNRQEAFDLQKYVQLKTIQISALVSGGWSSLSSGGISQLQNIATGNYGLASGEAAMVLNAYFNGNYDLSTLAYVGTYPQLAWKASLLQRDISGNVELVPVGHQMLMITQEEPPKGKTVQSKSVSLYDTMGRLFFTTNVSSVDDKINHELPSGIYLYSITNSDGHVSTGKIFIQ